MGFLGHILSCNSIAPYPNKLSTISDWQPPGNPLANYFSCFILSFTDICSTLFPLLKKGQHWASGPAQQASFQALKDIPPQLQS